MTRVSIDRNVQDTVRRLDACSIITCCSFPRLPPAPAPAIHAGDDLGQIWILHRQMPNPWVVLVLMQTPRRPTRLSNLLILALLHVAELKHGRSRRRARSSGPSPALRVLIRTPTMIGEDGQSLIGAPRRRRGLSTPFWSLPFHPGDGAALAGSKMVQ